MWHYILTQTPGFIAGFCIAAFAPRIGRAIKYFLVGESQKIEQNIAKKL